jgi:hypothetical protein
MCAVTARGRTNAGAHSTRESNAGLVFQYRIVPADGISAANCENGGFGMSPFLGSARASHYLPLSTELACRTESAIGDRDIILIDRADTALDVECAAPKSRVTWPPFLCASDIIRGCGSLICAT